MKRRYIPNALTLGNLLCGCIAAGAAFHHNFKTALLFIILGAVFDFFDGFAARLLKAPSPMGVELDSLADCITFGLAPSAMLFTLFTEVYYPSFMYSPFWFKLMPFTGFLLAAFSAYRLAKFNLDERQHEGFIGMPTPACALFWASLIAGSEDYLRSPMMNSLFLLLFVLMFGFLLISEIPMFSLKFKSFDLSNRENVVRLGFLTCSIVLIAVCGICAPAGHVWQYLCRGLAASIGLYVLVNIIRHIPHLYGKQ